MKHLSFIILCLLGSLSLSASVRGEYWIDTDPGLGQALPVTVSEGQTNTLAVDLSGLPYGYHYLGIRVEQDTIWSQTYMHPFVRIALSPEQRQQLNAAEYFIDTDPGCGKGTPLSVSPGQTDFSLMAALSNLSYGVHTIGLRVRQGALWSQVYSHAFLHVALSPEQRQQLNAAEYFIDTDPGCGKGTPLSVSPGQTDFSLTAALSNLSYGVHTIGLRVRQGALWSQVYSHTFLHVALSPEEQKQITAAEYWLDSDPGYGQATPISFSPNQTEFTVALSSLDSLPLGQHTIGFRVRCGYTWSMDYIHIINRVNAFTVTALADNPANGSVSGPAFCFPDSTVTLTATPAEHYRFVQWSDGDTTNPRVLTVTSDTTLTASFALEQYTVSFSTADASMGTITADVTTKQVAYGTVVTLTATPAEHYRFVQWSDGDTTNPRVLTVTSDTTLTASFALEQYTVSFSTADASMGTITADVTAKQVAYGTIVTLTATPAEHYRFVQWSDGDTTNPRVLTVTSDTTLTASFALEQYTVSFSTADASMGTITADVTAKQVAYGTVVTLTATPAEHYRFVQWSDGDTTNPRVLTVTSDTTLTASFALEQFTLTLDANDSSMGKVSANLSGSLFSYGTALVISAEPADGFRFHKWNIGTSDNPLDITITEDTYIRAIFLAVEEEPDTVTVTSTDQSASFSWPLIEGGYTYTLTVYADPECTVVLCIMTFDQDGNLVSTKYPEAPSRYRRFTQDDSFTCTILGLDPDHQYYFIMTTEDEDGQLLNTESGDFTTEPLGGAVDDVLSEGSDVRKLVINGHLYILRAGRVYTATGKLVY